MLMRSLNEELSHKRRAEKEKLSLIFDFLSLIMTFMANMIAVIYANNATH